jgi:hypothetical protein
MDILLDWAVVILPTLMALLFVRTPRVLQQDGRKLAVVLVAFGVVVSILTYSQQRGQRVRSEKDRIQLTSALETARAAEKTTQDKLDETLRQQRRDSDILHDVRTIAQATDEMQQVVKESLSPALRIKADSIAKHWRRDAYESVGVKDAAAAGRQPPGPKEPSKPLIGP